MKLPLVTAASSARQQHWAQLGQRLLDDIPDLSQYDHSVTLTECERYLTLYSARGHGPGRDVVWAPDRTTAAEQLADFLLTPARVLRAWDVETGMEAFLQIRVRESDPRMRTGKDADLQGLTERARRMIERYPLPGPLTERFEGQYTVSGRYLLVYQHAPGTRTHPPGSLGLRSPMDLSALGNALADLIYEPAAAVAVWDLVTEDPTAHLKLGLYLSAEYGTDREEIPLRWSAPA